MERNVLIATLGESPIVVTSMVDALQAKEGVKIDQLHVIHPPNTEKLITDAYQLVADYLGKQCTVIPCELSFPDTNSTEASMEFLQILSDLIQRHEREEDNVFLSLAGGRKNMSALMAVTCRFFPCVRGLYHILDRHENNPQKRNFYSTEELWLHVEEAQRAQKLSPPAGDLILVEIPYSPLSNNVDLSEYLSELEGEPAAFYREILQKKKTDLLDVYLSEEAAEFYQKNGSDRQRLKSYFRSMRDLESLSNHKHSFKGNKTKTDCTCFKKSRTQLRLFYYQTNSKIVVATITGHRTEVEYNRIINGGRQLCSKDHPPHIHFNELEEDSTLIVPLGKTPMVVTQTFKLLAERESVNVNKIIIVYPNNGEIRNGVKLLQNAFRNIGCTVKPIPIDNVTDITSKHDCNLFLQKLVSVIQKAKMDNPSNSIRLSLSGGRKGMAALTLFAAQQANIDVVYHTLITDAALERQIEEETKFDKLRRMPRSERLDNLFLNAYDESKFELFRVPVIPTFV